MKNLKSVLLFVFIAFAIKANATQYIIIHQRICGGYRLVYVSEPKNLKNWYYDSKNDIYYQGKGVPVETKFKADATQYVVIKVGGLSYRLTYVSKPNNLKKWYYDSKNDIYYRGKDGVGIPVKIKSKIRTS